MSTTTSGSPATTPSTGSQVELAITGMTCASCANRIERKLNKLDGVLATVNYATEKAKVTYADSVSPEQLLAAVEQLLDIVERIASHARA
jgi:Cu+-exporting ATPase